MLDARLVGQDSRLAPVEVSVRLSPAERRSIVVIMPEGNHW